MNPDEFTRKEAIWSTWYCAAPLTRTLPRFSSEPWLTFKQGRTTVKASENPTAAESQKQSKDHAWYSQEENQTAKRRGKASRRHDDEGHVRNRRRRQRPVPQLLDAEESAQKPTGRENQCCRRQTPSANPKHAKMQTELLLFWKQIPNLSLANSRTDKEQRQGYHLTVFTKE